MGPGRSMLKLAGNLYQACFVAITSQELYADWQTVRVPVHW
jgi:hypothetical protein